MNSDTRILVEGVSKVFSTHSRRHRSLKDVLRATSPSQGLFTALRDVNFEIHAGECVGLLGRNGSGKSTLLKCVSGIMIPTTGRVLTSGRVVPLLELGAGFQPDLSGRDNILLNARILGMTRTEVSRKFDSIVDFSELGDFLDTPLRHYSSGMYARLGFAVAIHVEPQIALFDEVMAVGDEAFREKCREAVNRLRDLGTIILLVTHSAEDILRTCSRSMVIDRGRIVFDGIPPSSVSVYRSILAKGD